MSILKVFPMFSVDDVLEIIDFVENFEAKGIGFAVLGTPTRSGSFLLHSLLDQHPQVLLLPTPFYYYFDWEFLFQFSTPDTLVDTFFSKSTTLMPYRPGLGPHQDIVLDFQFQVIAPLMKLILKRLKQVNRKTFLLLLHFVYGKYHGMDLKNIKILLLHHHAVPQVSSYFGFQISHQYFVPLTELESVLSFSPQSYRSQGDPLMEQVLLDFPDAKFIIPIRQPMAAIYSGINVYQTSVAQPELGLAFLVYYMCLLSYYNLYPLGQWLGEKCQFVKFEDLHGNPENTMRVLARFLGIEFHTCLLRSTFGGHDWYVERSGGKRICGTDSTIPAQDNHWQKGWSPETQAFYATLCAPLYPAFGYAQTLAPSYLEQSPTELHDWIPEEQTLYQAYPDFLTTVSDYIAEETRSREPSQRLTQVMEEQLALLAQKMTFLQHYPQIRQLLLQYFRDAKQDMVSRVP